MTLGTVLRSLFARVRPPRPATPPAAAPGRGRRPAPPIRARYDAAQTTDENKRHWANADNLSADAANSPGVRGVLRDRSRYECANNGYLGGVVRRQAEDLIGTGPRLQLSIPDADPATVKLIERAYRRWADAILLPEKLLIADEAKRRDGEVFGILRTNPGVAHPVKLDVLLVESEQVADPTFDPRGVTRLDGIEEDAHGNPTRYRVLKEHPGDTFGFSFQAEFTSLRAADVLHWFRADRPRQGRGICETKTALPTAPLLRRYTLAVLGAAEWAASVFGVISIKQPLDDSDAPAEPIQTMERVEFERGGLLSVPEGSDPHQFESKQPTATFGEFEARILNGQGAGMGVPYNVIAGNSSGYNYSSGRLDHLPYQRSQRIQRNLLRLRVLDRLFRAWWAEFTLIPAAEGGAPFGLPSIDACEWSWNWDGFYSIDPMKDAETDASRLESNTTTLAEIYAEYGQDWEEQVRQRAKELDVLESLGLTTADALPRPVPNPDDPTAPPETRVVRPGQKPTAGSAAAAGDVQATALNGAQITSLVLIADKVVADQYPADAAQAVIEAAFPLMDRTLIARFVSGLAKHTPPAPVEVPAHAA